MSRPAEPPPYRCGICDRVLRVLRGALVCPRCDGREACSASVKQRGAV